MIIGEAIGLAGPAIILAFVMAGITCVFSALSYAELASTMPVAGSAYCYSYATLGEFAAWIIGWDLILEYGLSVAAVAVGWGGYVQALLDSLFGIALSNSIAAPPGRRRHVQPAGRRSSCSRSPRCSACGIRETRPHELGHGRDQDRDPRCIFIALGITAFTRRQLLAVLRRGLRRRGGGGSPDLLRLHRLRRGLVLGRGNEEPERDMPIAIIGSLVIATVLYIAVAIVAVGALPFNRARRRHRAPCDRARQGRRISLGRRPDLDRRADRDHERRPDDPLRPDADRVLDVPRRALAAAVREGLGGA